MGLETGTRIQDLVPTNPVGATDFVSQGDDHIRLIKAAVQGSFPGLGATAVTANGAELNILDGATVSAAELNYSVGVTSSIQTQLNAKLASASYTAADVFAKVLTLDGSGSGLDADLLDGNSSGFYQTATNMTAGTLPDARLSANVPLLASANLFTDTQTATVADNSVSIVAKAASGQIRLHGYHSSFGGAFVQFRNGANSAAISVTFTATQFTFDTGLLVGAPSGGSSGYMGAGTVNADEGFFVDGRRCGFIDLAPQTSGWVRGDVYVITAGKTLNTADMAAGYTFCVYNDSAGALTITQGSGVTLRLHGTTTTGNRSLAPRGFATIWCLSNTEAIMMGDVT